MNEYPENWFLIAELIKHRAEWKCVRCKAPHHPEGGYCLTVHHLDMDKSNCESWNLAALCQRCHLKIQARVHMNQMYLFGHAEWMQPFIEGRKAARQNG